MPYLLLFVDFMLLLFVADDTCPLLINPENALVDLDCPQVAAVGVSCSQHCVDGFTWTDGDRLRTCGPDLKWTGLPIVCSGLFPCLKLLEYYHIFDLDTRASRPLN